MKRNIFYLLFFVSIIGLTSCSETKNNLNVVTINTDSCAKWNLPNLNLTINIPKDYIITYNSSGGFYLQAHKYNDKHKMLAEISIGRIEGDFNPDSSIDMLHVADREIRNQLGKLNQKYDTRFIGNDTITSEIRLPQLRNYIRFEKFSVALDGSFYGFTSPIFLGEKNRFILSAMFDESETFSDNRMISKDLIELIKSINPKIKN
jgi:hypothetical protein